MSGFSPEPSEDAVASERDEWRESQDTRGRIRVVVTGLREPETAATIAEWADCSANAARKHLQELAELGVVREQTEGGSTQYIRNEAYFRWQRANELATANSIETLLSQLGDLEDQEEAFRSQFDAAVPEDVELPDDELHAEIEQRLEELSEWATVREAIDRHKEALRIARREDDRLTA